MAGPENRRQAPWPQILFCLYAPLKAWKNSGMISRKMLKIIRRDRPSSIYELAKLLKRDVKNTFSDIHFLEQIGLIELKKTKEGRERSTPVVNYEKILLEIPV